ncbi:hypothetical protein BGX28_003689 [Mortierella sp. GBA30]|nr:hypothetical protein BGX28_003689 [Mortierella sp. GBA30]
MARDTSRADFWDLDSILARVSPRSLTTTISSTVNSQQPTKATVGVLSGQDLQPSTAVNYTIQEFETTAAGEERVALTLSTQDIPGTWLGITTHGDLIALTNYRESLEYMSQMRDPKLSRGKVCGEYLVTMAAAHDGAETPDASRTSIIQDRAEQWIKKRKTGWEDEFEGLNLLVVQNAGDQQFIATNREGSEMMKFNRIASDEITPTSSTSLSTIANVTISPSEQITPPGSVVGVSNSVFSNPWDKVTIGVQALEKALLKSVELFGTESHHAKLQTQALDGSELEGQYLDDDSKEIAWLVIEMLSVLRHNTSQFPEGGLDLVDTFGALRERVFIPKIALGKPDAEYGTRSSAVVLFGRHSRLAVFVEKVWYGPRDESTGKRAEYAHDSVEGLVWWQGLVGQPKEEWRQIDGQELRDLVQAAREIRFA